MSNRQIDDFDDVNDGEKGMENICNLIEGPFYCLFFKTPPKNHIVR